MREPSTEHPITVAPTGGRVVVRINGEVVAETRAALTLRESSYPAVQYIPIADVSAAVVRADTETYCPYKGEAGYYRVAGTDDAAWCYDLPYPAVAAIAGHVAFYPDKADITVSAE